MSKKALVVGINDYPGAQLHGCINDASIIADLLKKNEDGSKNFDVKTALNIKKKEELSSLIRLLFEGDDEIALLYFSGHGTRKDDEEYICTPDYSSVFHVVKLLDM